MSNSDDDRTAPHSDGPPDELEPGEVVKAELERLVRHPGAETSRLKRVAAEGEQGSTPFIEMALIARWIIPLVALVVGVIFLISHEAAPRTAAHARSPIRNVANGFRIFNDDFCSSCHAMKAAGPASYRGSNNVCNDDTACKVGVDFNKIHASYQLAIAAVTYGLPAAPPLYLTQMPPFQNVLTQAQIRDVAAFLAKYSGGHKTCIECKGIVPSGFPTG
jgi:mono/diheme cytochrome c family protein